MLPVLFKIGPFNVYAYGLMLVVGFLLALWLLLQQAQRQLQQAAVVFNFAYLVFFAGIAGARLFYVAENYAYYLQSPLEIIMLQQGGMSFFGGFFLGILAGFIYLKKKKIAVLGMLDLVAPFLALGQGIGRIGCFLNGCCYGRPSAFGVYFPVHNQVLIPIQIYSALILLLIFLILRLLQERPHRQGDIFLFYILLYSLKRFMVEFYRADNLKVALGLSLFQFISMVLFFVAGGLFFLQRPSQKDGL